MQNFVRKVVLFFLNMLNVSVLCREWLVIFKSVLTHTK